MALVLTAVGGFLYLRFERDLDGSIDRGLRSRAGDVSALVRQADSGLTDAGRSPLTDQGESFAQIIGGRGQVLDATPQLRKRAVLSGAELARARRTTVILEREGVLEHGERARFLATSLTAQDQRVVVVVGTSLEERDTALQNLLVLLFVGAPVALLLASASGYGVAAAALRPVEAMRRRATEIEDAGAGQRLPVSRADDEIARLGQTLNAMLDRLEEAFARERMFVSDASHELRTPLAILKAELELALRSGRTEQEIHDALGSAAEETDRLAQLAEDLLVIARSDQGRLPVRLASVDAAELLGSVKERFDRRAEGQGRSITVQTGPGQDFTGDPLRLEQALGNLVDNALRHGDGEVRLASAERAGRVEMSVRDQGAGFPRAFVGKAFERFTRADEARGSGGTGLGLAIVDAIARAHGGQAGVRDHDGQGAEVWIDLPAQGAVPASTQRD